MSSYLLDTDVLVDYFKGQSQAVTTIKTLAGGGHTLALCCINLAELYAGFSEQQREKTRPFLDRFAYFDITPNAARLAGEFRHRYARSGIALATTDTLIAATAVENGAYLATRNRSHFPMPEVRLFDLSAQP